jgi:hypothetical protein
VDFARQLGGGVHDADPADILIDFLTNSNSGLPSWSAGLIGDLSDWSASCRANNLLLSPVIDSQRQASDFIAELMTATNAEAVWSEGVLKIGSYGDTPATANGVSWAPDLTPAYDLTEDDLIPADGKPVKLEIVDQSDAYNMVQIEYLDRANQYNVAIAPAQDLANIVQYGRRKKDPTTLHSICDAAIAQNAAQLLLQRTLYMRELYTFTLPWNFALLEPMIDTVTLTTSTDELLLDRKQVRITQIEEDADGNLAVTAVGMDIGVASAAEYNSHSGSGYVPNLDVAPGSVSTPVLINAPAIMTGGDPQMWVAAASASPNWGGCEVWVSADNVDYQRVGRIEAPGRIGVASSPLPAHADPDAVNRLAVDMARSGAALSGTTAANADAGATLSIIGNEVITFETATLAAPGLYDLTMLRRGLYDTAPADHPAGTPFCRLDDAVFRFGYGQLNLDGHIYIKLPSFNVFGRAMEDVSGLPAYDVALTYEALTTDWSLVTGTGRPQDNATVGAPAGTPVGSLTADTVAAALLAIGQTQSADEVISGVEAMLGRALDVSVAQLQQQLLEEQRKARLDALTHLEGVAVGTRVRQEISARQEGDAQIVQSVTELSARVDDGFTDSAASLLEEATVRASADAAEVTTRAAAIAAITTNISEVTASIVTEATARATADAAETSAREAAVSSLSSDIASVTASLSSEATTRATADAAETSARAAAISALSADLSDSWAAIESEASTRATAISAETTARELAISSLSTDIAANQAAIVSEATTRADAVSAEADTRTGQIATLTTGLSAASAAISAETTARVDATGALASELEGVAASLDGLSGSVTSLREVLVDPQSGVTAKALFALNVDGHVVGSVQTNDGTIGSLTFVFDSYAFLRPDGTVLFTNDGDVLKLPNVEIDNLTDNTAVAPVVSTATTALSGNTSSTSAVSAYYMIFSKMITMPKAGLIEISMSLAQSFTSGLSGRPWHFYLAVDGAQLPESVRGGTVPGDSVSTAGYFYAPAAGLYTISGHWGAHSSIVLGYRSFAAKGFPGAIPPADEGDGGDYGGGTGGGGSGGGGWWGGPLP